MTCREHVSFLKRIYVCATFGARKQYAVATPFLNLDSSWKCVLLGCDAAYFGIHVSASNVLTFAFRNIHIHHRQKCQNKFKFLISDTGLFRVLCVSVREWSIIHCHPKPLHIQFRFYSLNNVKFFLSHPSREEMVSLNYRVNVLCMSDLE
jgi:hypothetical protein